MIELLKQISDIFCECFESQNFGKFSMLSTASFILYLYETQSYHVPSRHQYKQNNCALSKNTDKYSRLSLKDHLAIKTTYSRTVFHLNSVFQLNIGNILLLRQIFFSAKDSLIIKIFLYWVITMLLCHFWYFCILFC